MSGVKFFIRPSFLTMGPREAEIMGPLLKKEAKLEIDGTKEYCHHCDALTENGVCINCFHDNREGQ